MAIDDILSITDGVITIDLLRGPVRLAQDGYAPAVARRNPSALGGSGEWEDVEEDVALQVVAANADNPGRVYSQLQALLARAERVARGSAETPVRLRARPAGSRLAAGVVLESLLLGGEVEQLHESFTRMLEADTIAPARVTWRRRGAWLWPTVDEATPTAATSQQIQTIPWPTDHPVESPLSLAIRPTLDPFGSYPSIGATSRILLGATAAAFTVVEGESMNGGAFSASALAHARGGSVLNVTGSAHAPGGVGTSGRVTIAAFQRGEVYVLTRSTASIPATITLHLSNPTPEAEWDPTTTAYTGQVRLSASIPANQVCSVTYLGRVDSITPFTRMWLSLDTALGSGAVQVDSIVLHRDEGAIAGAIEVAGFLRYGASVSQNVVTVDARPLASPAPSVYQAETLSQWAPTRVAPTYGDAALQTRGITCAVLPLLIGRESGIVTYPEGMFVPLRADAPTLPVAFQVTARRHRAYLSLE